jgi:hypothetical protein
MQTILKVAPSMVFPALWSFSRHNRSVNQQGMTFPRVKDLQHNDAVLSMCFFGKIPHFISFT